MPYGYPFGVYPPRFKPVNGRYPVVKGGRWSVRKDSLRDNQKRPWRAFSDGRASYYNRRFVTFEEAIAWADRVAKAFAIRDDFLRQVALRTLKEEKYPHLKKGQ